MTIRITPPNGDAKSDIVQRPTGRLILPNGGDGSIEPPGQTSIALDPKTLNLALVSRTQILGSSSVQSKFIEQVLVPLAVKMPNDVEIKTGTHEGKEVLYISHPVKYRGETFNPGYFIVFGNSQRIKTPLVPSTKEPNLILLPDDINSSNLTDIQNGWRRTSIWDDFNSRFTSDEIIFAEFQNEGVKKVLQAFANRKNAFVHMATGSGKTLVGLKAMERFVQENGKSGEAVLFVLDNTVALGEAEKKLTDLFDKKYKASRIYDKNEDYGGDFIFATPSSLLSSGRLKTLLAKRKIAGVIFDEVHHIAATEYNIIKTRLTEANEDTVHLALTATKERFDKAPVEEHFGGVIDVDYPLKRGWREGYLTRIKVMSGDLDINPNNLSPIKPGTKLHDKYHFQRHSHTRFPHIFRLFKEATKGDIDRRTLILCTNIKYAKALAEYFADPKKKEFPGETVSTVALTYQERLGDEDEDFFKPYNAWKNGTGAEVVCGVRMFRESIDVPDIRYIIAVGATRSTLAFCQDIGRGTRPARLKTHLSFIDAGGVLRERAHMKFLADLYEQTVYGDEADPGIIFEQNLADVIREYEADIPSYLKEKYKGEYSKINSIEDLKLLDDFICKKTGFESKQALVDFLGETALKASKSSLKRHQVMDLRNRLRAAYYIYGIYEEDDFTELKQEEIPLTSETLIVFSRLFDLVPRGGENGISDEFMYQLFPEFGKDRRKMLLKRATNLRTLRNCVFHKNTEKMVLDLVENVIDEGLVDYHSPESIFILYQNVLVSNKDKPEGFINAEGGLTIGRTLRMGGGNIKYVTDEFTTIGHKELQEHLINLYLAHPRLKPLMDSGLLNADAFELSQEEFKKIIEPLFLASEASDTKEFVNVLLSHVERYTRAIQKEGMDKVREARLTLHAFITSKNNLNSISPPELVRKDISLLFKLREKIGLAYETLGTQKTKEDKEILSAMDNVLHTARVQCVIKCPGLKGVELVLDRRKYPSNYTLWIKTQNPAYTEHLQQLPLEIFYNPDRLGKPNVCVLRDTQSGRTKSDDFIITPDHVVNDFERLHDALDDARKESLENAIFKAFLLLTDIHEIPPVFLVAADRYEKTFYLNLYEKIKDKTTFDVIGGVDTLLIGKTQHGQDLLQVRYTLAELNQNSRLGFLTPDYYTELNSKTHAPTSDAASKLGKLYCNLYRFRRDISRKWEIVRKRFSEYSPPTDMRQPCIQLLRNTENLIQHSMLAFPKHMTALLNTFNLMCTGYPDEPLTDDFVRRCAVYQITTNEELFPLKIPNDRYFGMDEFESKALRKTITRILNQYMSLISKKTQIPELLLRDFNEFLSEFSVRFLNPKARIEYKDKSNAEGISRRFEEVYRAQLYGN